MKRKPAEINTGLWLSIKSETTCKNSAHLDEKKKQTKIRHRMVMLEGLQLEFIVKDSFLFQQMARIDCAENGATVTNISWSAGKQ